MPVTQLECPKCGASLDVQPGIVVATCTYCQAQSHIDWQRLGQAPRPTQHQTSAPRPKRLALVLAAVLGIAAALGALGIVLATKQGESAIERVISKPAPIASTVESHAMVATETHEVDPARARLVAVEAKMKAAVVSCLNRFSHRALQSRERYRSWVPDAQGPTPRSRYKYGLYELGDTSDCTKAIAQARAIEPAIEPLDHAAFEFARELETLAAIANEANRYYDRADYKDDAMARGAEMHEPLLRAFARFDAARAQLELALDGMRDEVLAAKQNELAPQDNFNRMRLDAMRAAFEIANLGNVPWKKIASIELETFEAKVVGFERMIASLQNYRGDEAKSIARFLSAADKFALAAKEEVRRIRSKGGWSSGDRMMLDHTSSHWMVEGSPGAMIAAYAHLADASDPVMRHVAQIELIVQER
jgi:hypothetical protein